MRPLLLLDIDGVICPMGPSGSYIWHEEHEVYWSPETRSYLAELSNSFHLVWASFRGRQANDDIGILYGLPPLASIDFSCVNMGDQTFKLESVDRYVGNKPTAWLDDHLYDDAIEWAKKRSKSVPTLAIQVDPYAGFSASHKNKLTEFAEM